MTPYQSGYKQGLAMGPNENPFPKSFYREEWLEWIEGYEAGLYDCFVKLK